MAKHTLFLVHGMGRHPGDAWAAEIWNKLVECSRRYPHFEQRQPLDDYAEPVAVGYDRFIEQALQRWTDQAASFRDFVRASELRWDGELDWLDDVLDDDPGFVRSNIADVLIYRLFRLESGQIRANVIDTIYREIERKRGLDASSGFSLMAHSLGTAVAHDALAFMGSASHIDGTVNAFGSANFRFDSIHMLANVSRALETEFEAYHSVVRPGPNAQPDRYCGQMYAYRHELDPITMPKRFDPDGWGSDFEMVEVDHYREANVHAWLHYLDHPRVHIPILRSISRSSAINPREQREAVNDYPRFGGDFEGVNDIRAKIEEIKTLADEIDSDRDLAANYAALVRLWAALDEL